MNKIRNIFSMMSLLFFITIMSGILFVPATGQALECGAGMVPITCPGNPTTCAIAPAVCCGNSICGAGMSCLSCPKTGPVCVVNPAVCCGGNPCGGGMQCRTTSLGPECFMPVAGGPGGTGGTGGGGPGGPGSRGGGLSGRSSALLGKVWVEKESGWDGVWTRIGSTKNFDAVWTKGSHRVTAVLTIHIDGNKVTVDRKNSSDENDCRYRGTLAEDGMTVKGTYGCTIHKGPYNWQATIRK